MNNDTSIRALNEPSGRIRPPQGDNPAQRLGPLFYVGAGGLLCAMAIEAVAVVGRHIGAPLLGSLEIIQTCILLMASSAMLSATLNGSHASVHLLTDRLPPLVQGWLRRIAALLSALFFICLAAGSLWLTLDFWAAHEESELLHIPYRPLRVISLLAIATIALVFVRDALRSEKRQTPS